MIDKTDLNTLGRKWANLNKDILTRNMIPEMAIRELAEKLNEIVEVVNKLTPTKE